MSQFLDEYEQLKLIRDKIAECEKEVAELREATFGAMSVEEEVARRFFNEIAISTEEIRSKEEELSRKSQELKELQVQLKKAEENFLKALTRLKFPLKLGSEGINKQDNEVAFLYNMEIPKEKLQEIRRKLGDDSLASNDVEIQTDKIVVKNVSSVSEAMEKVMNHIEKKIWKAATGILEIDKDVKKLKSREEKIQRMLYVLFEAGDKPLSKKEIEIRAGLKPGDLRGVLYLVLDRDPYIKKVSKGLYKLTEVGKKVMAKYKEMYGSPITKEEKTGKTLENYGLGTAKEEE